MNYLAHSFLSFEYNFILLGNFIADTIKNIKPVSFHPEIQKGIALHHHIDYFTDHHPLVKQSKNRLNEKYGHYDSIIIDILYDHFLAINWSRYSPIQLEQHAKKTYSLLEYHYHLLPDRLKEALPYMIKQNWLVSYGTKEGISNALRGMSRRASFESHMDEALEDLNKNFVELENDFLGFFPELIQSCLEKIDAL
jgi:acyl carrier protein phosphodiesterase